MTGERTVEMVQVLGCSCGSEDLSTVESLSGLAPARVRRLPDGRLDIEFSGWTDVDWDSSTTTGYWCNACQELRSEGDLALIRREEA